MLALCEKSETSASEPHLLTKRIKKEKKRKCKIMWKLQKC